MRSELYDLVEFIQQLYPNDKPVPLHAPRFSGKEKENLGECIDSTFVSYVGAFVSQFESQIQQLTGIKHAIAMVNGTAALQMSLIATGIEAGDEVITQALTFVATANGIQHAGGVPVFIDVDRDTLGMSPSALEEFLSHHAEKKVNGTFNKVSGRRIFGIMPMHTFGFACRVHEIADICSRWNLYMIEDTAESLGTWVDGLHTGSLSNAASLSFNGNKLVTTGGGGMLITNNDAVAEKARHISTTAKRKHQWEFFHDELGWNLRLPNINAAIGCAQMDQIDTILKSKRNTAAEYLAWGGSHNVSFVSERNGTKANYWLNTVLLENKEEREEFLTFSNSHGVQTRPIWILMNKLPMYCNSLHGPLENAQWLEDRVVNLPSSIR